MDTLNSLTALTPTHMRYAITEAKKADLDALTLEVLNAQGQVEEMQAIVNALTQKSATFQAFLSTSEANMKHAFNNKNFAEEVVVQSKDLENESKLAFIQMAVADKRMKEVSEMINDVMNKLIYSADVINKLANTVIKEKALNPLISDELINMIGVAGTDANNAVALCLVALESCFAAQATNLTAESTTALQYKESVKLYELISGLKLPPLKPANDAKVKEDEEDDNKSIIELIDEAYLKSVELFETATQVNNDTTEQLEYAKDNLSRAQIKLQSLQAGLAAANAAALAS